LGVGPPRCTRGAQGVSWWSGLPESEPTRGDGYPLGGLAPAGEPCGEREDAEHSDAGESEERQPSENAADPKLDDGGDHDGVDRDEGEGGPHRVPLREREREPDSAGVHSPPVQLAGGQGEPFGRRRREDVAQAGQDEADADRRAPGDACLGTQEAVNQQAEKQEAGGLACNSDGGPAEPCLGQRAHRVGEAARREHDRVDDAGADGSADGPLHPASSRDGGSCRVDGRRRARLAAGRPFC